MDRSATLTVSQPKNDSSNFKKIVVVCLAVIAVLVCLAVVYQKKITLYLFEKIPVTTDKSFVFFNDLLQISIYELLWCGFILVVALILTLNNSFSIGIENVERMALADQGSYSRKLILCSSLLFVVIALIVLQQFPNSSDEYVYLYQAQTLADGKLYRQAHPVSESFIFNHIAVKDGIAVGRFPIGWPLILAVFVFLRIPAALANPILAIMTLFIFYSFAKRFYGARTALWSLMIVGFSSFFLFNSASFFSHTSCLLETLLFVYCIYLYLDKFHWKYGLLAGVALGLIMLIRYYTAALLFLPFFIFIVHRYKWTAFRLFFLIGLGALPCLVAFLLYNYEITGNPLTPVTVWGYKNEGLGFINGHTFVKGVEHILRRFFMFSYWSAVPLLVMYFYYLIRKAINRDLSTTVPEDYLFIVFIAGYLFYYEIGGNQYGPRFYYEAYPFLILFVVQQVFASGQYFSRIFLYASVLVILIRIPFIAYREHKIVDLRQNVFDLVDQAHLSNAVVLLGAGTCDIRPMPTGDLTRNDPEFNNDVLYAMDKPLYNPALMAMYPHRKFYRYERTPDEENGRLIRLR